MRSASYLKQRTPLYGRRCDRMKRAVIICRAGNPNPHQKAFGTGLQRCGWAVQYHGLSRTIYPPSELIVAWGVRVLADGMLAKLKAEGRDIVVLERAYLGDRWEWTSVSRGGLLSGRATFATVNDDGARWRENFEHLMKPWKPSPDGHVLTCGQLINDMSLRNCPNVFEIYGNIRTYYRQRKRPVKFRGHPGADRIMPHHMQSLEADLAGAYLQASYNSNTGVIAVLEGVPVLALDAGSMVYELATHEIGEEPIFPDRTKWAHRIAWCQFTNDEMANGLPHEVLGI